MQGDLGTPDRPLTDRLIVRMPWLAPLYARIVLALPPSPPRRWLVMDFLRRSAAALNRRDYDVHLLGFAPEVEWVVRPDQPDTDTYRGVVAIKAYLESYFEPWEDFENEPLDVLLADRDGIVFTSRLRARGSRSDATVEQLEAYCVELRRGEVVRLHEFRDGELALRTALELRARAAHAAERPGRWVAERGLTAGVGALGFAGAVVALLQML